MAAYDQRDCEQHQLKYALFRTARIAEAITSVPELAVGTMVNVRYFATRINAERGNAVMPIYQVWTDDNEDLKAHPAMIFACALGDFCL